MQESGELDAKASPADLATGLLGAVQGGYLLSQARRDPESMRISLGMAVDHIRSYVGASAAGESRPKTGRRRANRA
jgi:hypothetical protein